jgi:hypothetical protein
LSEAEQRQILIALEAFTDFELSMHAHLYELTFDEACAVWICAIDRLLPVS